MEIYPIETGNFMLDGGAMFGVVPKTLWEKQYPADEKNLCNLSSRSLLVVDGKRKILIDTGLGDKQSDKFFSYYYRNGNFSLDKSLAAVGFTRDDITDVILTHLHFDHCGGTIERNSSGELVPAFKNATFFIGKRQWKWAMNANQREKASFLYENIMPIEESGQLKYVHNFGKFAENIMLRAFDGHTEGLIIPFVNYKGTTVVYMSDLIPTSAHVPLSWICGYDTQPLKAFEEKESFLEEALENQYVLFFEHDIKTECCTLKRTEKGIRVDKIFSLNELG